MSLFPPCDMLTIDMKLKDVEAPLPNADLIEQEIYDELVKEVLVEGRRVELFFNNGKCISFVIRSIQAGNYDGGIRLDCVKFKRHSAK